MGISINIKKRRKKIPTFPFFFFREDSIDHKKIIKNITDSIWIDIETNNFYFYKRTK